MNGPEHYAEAERFIGKLDEQNVSAQNQLIWTGLAQAHAALAVAAATIDAAQPTGARTSLWRVATAPAPEPVLTPPVQPAEDPQAGEDDPRYGGF